MDLFEATAALRQGKAVRKSTWPAGMYIKVNPGDNHIAILPKVEDAGENQVRVKGVMRSLTSDKGFLQEWEEVEDTELPVSEAPALPLTNQDQTKRRSDCYKVVEVYRPGPDSLYGALLLETESGTYLRAIESKYFEKYNVRAGGYFIIYHNAPPKTNLELYAAPGEA